MADQYHVAKMRELERIHREKEEVKKEAEKSGIHVKFQAVSPDKEKLNLANKKEKDDYVKQTKAEADHLIDKQKAAKFKEDADKKNSSPDHTESDKKLPQSKKNDFKSDLSEAESNLTGGKDKQELIKKKKEIESQLKTLKEQEERLELSMGLRSSRKLDYSNMDLSHISDENFDFDREMARAQLKKNGKGAESQTTITKPPGKTSENHQENPNKKESKGTDHPELDDTKNKNAVVGLFDIED